MDRYVEAEWMRSGSRHNKAVKMLLLGIGLRRTSINVH